MSTLDPRSDLLLDVLELGRRAGNMVEKSFTATAPEDLGVAAARVPARSPMELDVRLESVVEGVLVTGVADVMVEAECSRCLEPVSWNEDIEFSELYVYEPTDARGHVVERTDGADEDEQLTLKGDLIDLEPMLRDAVVLALPLAPVCTDDCLGLCSECGVNLNDDPTHTHDTTDPRWGALASLLEPEQE